MFTQSGGEGQSSSSIQYSNAGYWCTTHPDTGGNQVGRRGRVAVGIAITGAPTATSKLAPRGAPKNYLRYQFTRRKP